MNDFTKYMQQVLNKIAASEPFFWKVLIMSKSSASQ